MKMMIEACTKKAWTGSKRTEWEEPEGFYYMLVSVTMIMTDYSKFKYALLAVMSEYVLLKQES